MKMLMLFFTVAKPSDVLKVGQEIEAQVTEYKEEGHKISLSMKALLDDEPVKDNDEDVADVDIEKVGKELSKEAEAEEKASDTEALGKAEEKADV